MRELNSNEITEVRGGVLFPLLAAIVSFAAHPATRTIGGYLVKRAASAYAVVAVAQAVQSAKDKRKEESPTKDN